MDCSLPASDVERHTVSLGGLLVRPWWWADEVGISKEPMSGVGPVFSDIYEDIEAIGGAVTGARRAPWIVKKIFFIESLVLNRKLTGLGQ